MKREKSGGVDIDTAMHLSMSHSARLLTPNRNLSLDNSAFIVSRLNMLDDLLQETFAKKQSLTQTNAEYLDRYFEAFQDKVVEAKMKRK